MTSIAEEILSHWQNNQEKYASQIQSISDSRWPAWTINLSFKAVGVALPLPSDIQVEEDFSSVKLRCISIPAISSKPMLALISFEKSYAFASLCAQFVTPGNNGKRREQLISNPVVWWKEWKGLLGNKNVEKKVYDVLGELVGLATLFAQGHHPKWTGAQGISTDIDCGSEKYEVKSTTVRNSKSFEAHGLFQLSTDTVPKYLLFAQFEPSEAGCSINRLMDHLYNQGLPTSEYEENLKKLGYAQGASARTKMYRLLGLSKYEINDSFPHIEPSSFVGGTLPEGVTSISYHVSLDGICCKNMLSYVPEINA